MTVLPTMRPELLAKAQTALYSAIDEAMLSGRRTPCHLSSAYDDPNLDVAAAAKLVRDCRTRCPVLDKCREVASLLPADVRSGAVVGGTYYPTTTQPQWQTLYDDLRDLIETGHYLPGDRLPTIDELPGPTKLHRTVIRTALAHLERDGLVVDDGGDARLVVSYGSILGSRQVALDDANDTDGSPAVHETHNRIGHGLEQGLGREVA